MERIPICPHCFNADLKGYPLNAGGEKKTLWHCTNCDESIWVHHNEPEELRGLARLCATRRNAPDKCRQDILFRLPDLDIRSADQICIQCPNKDFVIP